MIRFLIPAILISFLLAGCPSTKETAVTDKPPKPPEAAHKKPPAPEIAIRLASLNLSKHSKKIELADIEQLAAALRKDTVEILALQGITRYPDLKNRSDIIEELAARSEMRHIFGETINLSGRQQGNAVFSYFPIRSSENTHYQGIRSSGFEAVLQAVIDCGPREIVVSSTLLPEKASLDEQTTCAGTLASFVNFYINHPVIITGNLPRSENISAMAQYSSAVPQKGGDTPVIWYSKDGSVRLLSSKTEDTSLGRMFIATFAVYRQTNP